MKISKDIQGKNRLRDHFICELYIKGTMPEEIQKILSTSTRPIKVSRIYKVISANAKYINPKMGWDKTKRLHRLQRLADLNQDKLSPRKDTIDIMEQIRKEMEGDKPLVDLSKHEHITVVLNADVQPKQTTDRVLVSSRT